MKTITQTALAYTLALSAIFGFWLGVGQPRPIPEAELADHHTLQCVSYAPFEKDQSPFDFAKGMTIDPARIDADLAILSTRFSCIRTYSVAGLEALPRYAEKYGMQVLLGAWIGADPKLNQQELTKVVALAKQHPTSVRAVVVGNEVLLRREITGPQLAEYIRQVKTGLPGVEVTYADVWEFWLKHPEVAPACDFVTIHILPYWEDNPVGIDQAMGHIKKVREEIGEKIPGKKILIGETGWPSQGRMREGALPSLENQARFIRGFIALAEQEHWQYNLIEAFDQPWKRVKEGAVGGYWGLYSTDRTDKHILSGPVSNFPNWRMLFAQSAAIGLLTLLIARGHGDMGAARWLQFSVAMAGGAILIVLQGHQFAVISRSLWEYAWAFAVLGLSASVWLLALAAIASGEKPGHAGLYAAMDFVRGNVRITREIVFGLLRLGIVTCAMIAALVLLCDARYRSFNNFGFLVPALAYAWFPRNRVLQPSKGQLELLCALLLAFAGLGILVNETPLNLQADVWVTLCLLLSWPLWQDGKGSSLKALLPWAGVAALGVAAALALRHWIFQAESLVDVCASSPNTLICTVRSALGVLVYHQTLGWTSLALAVLALLWQNAMLTALALAMSVASLLLYNADMGAIACVLTTLSLAYRSTPRACREK